MKHVLTPLLLVAAVALGFTPSVRGQDNDAIKTKLKQIEDDWATSGTDKDHGVAFLGTVLADDYAGVNSKAKHQSKADYVEETKSSGDTITSAENSNMEVHVYAPNLATVTGDITEKGKDKSGKSFTRAYSWVDTFMERNGKWECVGEGSTIAAGKK